MSISLYEAVVPPAIQTMMAMDTCFERARKYFQEQGRDVNELVECRVHPDMLPFHFQVVCIPHFSKSAIEAAKTGVIGGPNGALGLDYDGLQDHLRMAIAYLESVDEAEFNALAGGEVVFHYPDNNINLPFRTQDFFMSYAMPNFYFHCAMTYALFRAEGVPIGVANWMGVVNSTPSINLPSDVVQQDGKSFLAHLEKLIEVSYRKVD